MDFNEVLKNGVVGYSEEDKLAEERAKLVKLLEEEKSNVIKDPSKIKGLEKQIEEIDKKISKLKKAILKDNEDKGKVVSEEQQEAEILDDAKKPIDEKEEPEVDDSDESIAPPSDDEKLPEEESKEKGVENEQALKETYHNALIALYHKKEEVIRKQIENGELVSSDSDFNEENRLEAAMYLARDKYLALGKEDPYEEEKTRLIRKDRDLRDKIEEEFRRRASEYKELVLEEEELNRKEEELNRLFQIGEITQEDLDEEQRKIAIRREKIGERKAKVESGLKEAIEIRAKRTIERGNLVAKEYESLTNGDKRNYNYQKNRVSEMTNNVNQGNKLEQDNIKERIAARKAKIKNIYIELSDKRNSTDFERRLRLLKELDNEALLLDQDLQAQSYIDRGIELTETEAIREAYSNYKAGEESIEEIESSGTVREIEADIAELEEMEGSNPNMQTTLQDKKVQEDEEINRREGTVIEAAEMTDSDDIFGDFILDDSDDIVEETVNNTHPLGSKLETYDITSNPEHARLYLEKVKEIDEKQDNLTRTITEQAQSI